MATDWGFKVWNWVKSPYENEKACIVGPFYLTMASGDESSVGSIYLGEKQVFQVEKVVEDEAIDELSSFIGDHCTKIVDSIEFNRDPQPE